MAVAAASVIPLYAGPKMMSNPMPEARAARAY